MLLLTLLLVIAEKSSQISSQCNDTDDKADCCSSADTNSHNFKIGSDIKYGDPVQHGVIKWIGKLPDQTEISAGVEMVSHGMFTVNVSYLPG